MSQTPNFAKLYDYVLRRFAGDQAALEAYLPTPSSDAQLRALGDDRYLSLMTQRIFRAGLKHAVVDARWPDFEEAFWGFVPRKMLLLDGEHFARLMGNAKLIRHLPKLKSIPINAQMILQQSDKHGGFGHFIANWPSSDIVGLWRFLQKNGAQLGGVSAAAFLRMAGKDTFMLDRDLTAALIARNVLSKPASSLADIARCQAFMNELSDHSGRPLCHLSMLLSLTVNHGDEPPL